MKVFLGGTCNDSTWRETVKERLKIDYFDPVVKKWDDAARQREIEARATCDFLLYVITPKQKGFYAIAEVTHDSVTRPHKTLLCVLSKDDGKTWRENWPSIKAVMELVKNNGAKVFRDLDEVVEFLNGYHVEIEPDPFMVECLIERDGPTAISVDGHTYVFEKNKAGDYVCRVENKYHRKYLLALPDFRIYNEDKLPEPEFTEDEIDFMNEWKVMDRQTFFAYMNSNVERFMAARQKIRDIAQAKWQRLIPGVESPIDIAEYEAGIKKRPIPEPEPEPEQAPKKKRPMPRDVPPDWKQFHARFAKLNAENFKKFIDSKDYEEELLRAPDVVYQLAKAKWDRLVEPAYGEPWPYEEVEEEDELIDDSKKDQEEASGPGNPED